MLQTVPCCLIRDDGTRRAGDLVARVDQRPRQWHHRQEMPDQRAAREQHTQATVNGCRRPIRGHVRTIAAGTRGVSGAVLPNDNVRCTWVQPTLSPSE